MRMAITGDGWFTDHAAHMSDFACQHGPTSTDDGAMGDD
jgi:hypothetical protein